jgi:hypothetical protein
MSNKTKKKKVNHLNKQECKSILDRLSGQTENKYYQEVLKRYNKI